MTITEFTVGPPSVLELEFVHHPEWTPPGSARTPIVVLRFEDVHILEWRQDDIPPEAPLGQVSTFDWYGADLFMMDTLALRLEFRARRMRASVRARAGQRARKPRTWGRTSDGRRGVVAWSASATEKNSAPWERA
ncbi:hypothetical protein [Nonomuraea aridisoli]|uniref:hypothetical protein n=1 Tax=Nonomuraea aridisoli TaxID=2070368 RepID=UPI0011B938BC|nr:hypothetical protein [Nonomuraea aridisoli]